MDAFEARCRAKRFVLIIIIQYFKELLAVPLGSSHDLC